MRATLVVLVTMAVQILRAAGLFVVVGAVFATALAIMAVGGYLQMKGPKC